METCFCQIVVTQGILQEITIFEEYNIRTPEL